MKSLQLISKTLRDSYDLEIEHYPTIEITSRLNNAMRLCLLMSIVLLGSILYSEWFPFIWAMSYVGLNLMERRQVRRVVQTPSFANYLAVMGYYTGRMLTYRVLVVFLWLYPEEALHFPALCMAIGAILFSFSQGAQLRSYAIIQSIGDSLLLFFIALSFIFGWGAHPSGILSGASAFGIMIYHGLVFYEIYTFRQAARELEKRNRQSQKMEAVGRLTGGVAHDFNNILTVVMGNLDLYKEVKDPAEKDMYADLAHEAAERASRLTAQLLAFARQSPLLVGDVDVDALLDNFTAMARRVLPATIKIETLHAPGIPFVRSDRNQLENALLNLAINARDAMPTGGELTIEVKNATLPQNNPMGAPHGRYVEISVRDTGEGIAPMHMANVFEPFFTTKDVGKGSGLGLSMVKGYCEQLGGGVAIDSALGQGTTVSMFLPANLAQPGAKPARHTASDARPEPQRESRIKSRPAIQPET